MVRCRETSVSATNGPEHLQRDAVRKKSFDCFTSVGRRLKIYSWVIRAVCRF